MLKSLVRIGFAELDPRMFDGRLPAFANTRSMRVAGGLGTVARVVGDAQEYFEATIKAAQAKAGASIPDKNATGQQSE